MGNHTENIVEEYYRRQRYFTIAGVRQGVYESDIFAIRHNAQKGVEALHIEVQTSFRPVAYLSNKNARKRNDEVAAAEIKIWMQKKFFSQKKKELRERLWPSAKWQLVFVHSEVKDRRELLAIQDNGIQLLHFSTVISNLASAKPKSKAAKGEYFTTSSAGDVSEVLTFFASYVSTRVERD